MTNCCNKQRDAFRYVYLRGWRDEATQKIGEAIADLIYDEKIFTADNVAAIAQAEEPLDDVVDDLFNNGRIWDYDRSAGSDRIWDYGRTAGSARNKWIYHPKWKSPYSTTPNLKEGDPCEARFESEDGNLDWHAGATYMRPSHTEGMHFVQDANKIRRWVSNDCIRHAQKETCSGEISQQPAESQEWKEGDPCQVLIGKGEQKEWQEAEYMRPAVGVNYHYVRMGNGDLGLFRNDELRPSVDQQKKDYSSLCPGLCSIHDIVEFLTNKGYAFTIWDVAQIAKVNDIEASYQEVRATVMNLYGKYRWVTEEYPRQKYVKSEIALPGSSKTTLFHTEEFNTLCYTFFPTKAETDPSASSPASAPASDADDESNLAGCWVAWRTHPNCLPGLKSVETVVVALCKERMAFTAWNVTEILRANTPESTMPHREVREKVPLFYDEGRMGDYQVTLAQTPGGYARLYHPPGFDIDDYESVPVKTTIGKDSVQEDDHSLSDVNLSFNDGAQVSQTARRRKSVDGVVYIPKWMSRKIGRPLATIDNDIIVVSEDGQHPLKIDAKGNIRLPASLLGNWPEDEWTIVVEDGKIVAKPVSN